MYFKTSFRLNIEIKLSGLMILALLAQFYEKLARLHILIKSLLGSILLKAYLALMILKAYLAQYY